MVVAHPRFSDRETNQYKIFDKPQGILIVLAGDNRYTTIYM